MIKLSESKERFYTKIKITFPPGKFSAPKIEPDRLLLRNRAIHPLISSNRRHSQCMLIQAQAGQGKSTFAVQLLQHIQARFGWIQIDSEDRDPVVFITSILVALLQDFPELLNTTVYQAMVNGELNDEEPALIVKTLQREFTPLLHENYYLVLDDLHLVKEVNKNIGFLYELSSQMPLGFHLIMLSRSPIEGLPDRCLRLNNEDLAFNINDVRNLFTKIFKIPLSSKMLTQLHHGTEGWIMGLTLAKHALVDQEDSYRSMPLDSIWNGCHPGRVRTYFQNEMLSFLSIEQREMILSMALLENIPLDLAEALTVKSNAAAFIEQLFYNNFFLRCVDGNPPSYYFHHLFKEFLEDQADKELSGRQRRKILAKAGKWHLSQNQKEPALRYYLRAGAYGMADKILREVGLELMATNRTATLKEIVSKIPHEVVRSYSWLSFFIANVYLRTDPFQSQIYLNQTRHKFIEHSDSIGELLATTTLIAFHAGIDCGFKQGKALLPGAETLYHALSEKLSHDANIQSAYAIALGLCYFTGQTHRAAEYINSIFRLAEDRKLDNVMAEAAVARGLIYSLQGNLNRFRQHTEETLFLLSSPRVSSLSKGFLFSQQLALLGLEGDFTAYDYYIKQLNQLIDPKLHAQTICSPLLLIADINRFIAEDRLEEALRSVVQGLSSLGAGRSAHLRSLYLGYQAYISALSGQRLKALSAAKRSAHLREEAGGDYHEMVNKMILGSIFTLLNLPLQAERFLSDAISDSKELGETFVRVSAYAQRAFLRLNQRQIMAAIDDLRYLLRILKKNQYFFFHTWHPRFMQKILTAAISHNIESAYAQKLANERLLLAITPEGENIPILEILTLGKVELKLNGEIKMTAAELSANQQELLALLAASSRNGLPLEIIQVIFWPDSSPEKVRSKLDNLLTRFRKILNKFLAPYPAGLYLSTEKGIVRLANCRIDAAQFIQETRTGQDHMKKSDFWQACNAFSRAHLLYKGDFMPGVRLREQALHFSEVLQRTYLESAQHWADILSAIRRVPEAIAVCRKALAYEPTCQPLVKRIYHLLTQSDAASKSKEIIENYKKNLLGEGFSVTEIESIMEDFWRIP